MNPIISGGAELVSPTVRPGRIGSAWRLPCRRRLPRRPIPYGTKTARC